jgi:hypothetical protein
VHCLRLAVVAVGRAHHLVLVARVLAVQAVQLQVTRQEQTRVAVVAVQEAQHHQAVVQAVQELFM